MRHAEIIIQRVKALNLNPVITFLILSDVVLVGGGELLSPIFAIFIVDKIQGGNAAVVGISASIYLIVKSLGQIPLGYLIDRIPGERDDFVSMFIGTCALALLPLSYFVIDTALELYLVQALMGLAAAAAYPPYMAIFTRHIDHHHEGKEWSIRFTLVDMCAAAAAAIGGYIAVTSGFGVLIGIYVAVSVIGAAALWPIRRYLRQKVA